ncbi:hypothetical protein [Amycolatopsis sp. EV170708-02-1]|uniref:hypothetical protein n=1 Tax=Amycolatopsis sp. EV170708-02-1 TaxID=2919322 RepID=UPI001F0C6960|nr:hypothetical protein [Amycolatopsis sp. EV170708-02-1]UMP07079.1 hypothetical protein MJQ72_20680 [Amycolatopsis sp. EV170708-02-1]
MFRQSGVRFADVAEASGKPEAESDFVDIDVTDGNPTPGLVVVLYRSPLLAIANAERKPPTEPKKDPTAAVTNGIHIGSG